MAELDRLNIAATVPTATPGVFFWTLVVGVAAVVGLGVAACSGGLAGAARRDPGAGRRVAADALVAAALPVATYLAGLVPWERTGSPALALLGAVLAADLAVVCRCAVAGPWRRRRLGPPLVVLAVTSAPWSPTC